MRFSYGVILCSLLIAVGQAQDDPSKLDRAKDQEEKAARMEYMKQAAKSYQIAVASNAADKLNLIRTVASF